MRVRRRGPSTASRCCSRAPESLGKRRSRVRSPRASTSWFTSFAIAGAADPCARSPRSRTVVSHISGGPASLPSGCRRACDRATEAALRSGASFPEALRRATEGTEDRLARRPFVDALRAFDLGAPLDRALRTAAHRSEIDARSQLAFETLAIGIESRLPYERAAVLVEIRRAPCRQ